MDRQMDKKQPESMHVKEGVAIIFAPEMVAEGHRKILELLGLLQGNVAEEIFLLLVASLIPSPVRNIRTKLSN